MQEEMMQTRAFAFQCWLSFILAFAVSLVGIVSLPLEAWMRAFVAVAYLFTVSSSFTLAKTLRDRHEARRLVNRLDEARTEDLLRRFAAPTD